MDSVEYIKKIIWNVEEKEEEISSPITCPYCFKEFLSSEVVFRAAHFVQGDPEYQLQEDIQLNQYRKRHGKMKVSKMEAVIHPDTIYEENKKVANGVVLECVDKYGAITAKRLCPFCHNALPFFAGKGPSCIISIIGARKAGKSDFVSALLQLLKQEIAEGLNCMWAVDPRCRHLLEYYEDLAREKEGIKALEAEEPIIFYLKDKEKKKAPLTLIFYDVPSEAMTSQENMEAYGESIRNSDGIIFLIDPMQFKCIRERKKEENIYESYAIEDPRDIIVQLYENFISLQSGDKTSIPTAIVITKSDEIEEELREIKGEAEFFINAADRVFKDGLEMYFSNVAYFTVSQKIKQKTRIEEPFLWILQQLKYVGGGKLDDTAAVLYTGKKRSV